MNNRMVLKLAEWVLVLGGLAWAYDGATGSNIIERVFRGLAPVVDIALLGGAALYLGYHLLTHKH